MIMSRRSVTINRATSWQNAPTFVEGSGVVERRDDVEPLLPVVSTKAVRRSRRRLSSL
jgi:hypothetical protein